MNEKGLIGYYNLFIVLFVILSISCSFIFNLSTYRKEIYQYELLKVIQNNENMIYQVLYEIALLDKKPSSYLSSNDELYYISIYDETKNYYLVKHNNNTLKYSSFQYFEVIVLFENNTFEIISWEYTYEK